MLTHVHYSYTTTPYYHYNTAGIQQAPFYVTSNHHSEQPGEWLHRLAQQRTLVGCQLISRRATREERGGTKRNSMAEFQTPTTVSRLHDQTAVCRIYYRHPKRFLFSKSDLAESLVRYGRASVASGMHVVSNESLPATSTNTVIVDTSTRVEDLRKDAQYMEGLEQAEYEAAKESRGMWADPVVRQSRPDLVEEIDFQTKASFVQKLWRWFRGA